MIFSSRTDSVTTDEKVHITAGYLHFWEGNYTFNVEHPPFLNDLAGLFAKIAHPNLPQTSVYLFQPGNDQWEYADRFFYESGNNVEIIVFYSRLPFIFITLGLIYLVFLWAKALFGDKAGLVAVALTAFSPNILAHGRLATTDIGVAFFFLLTLYLLRKYYLKANRLNATLLGVSLGLALISKFSALIILPIIFLSVIYILFKKKLAFSKSIFQFSIIFILPIVLIWGIYAFSMRMDLIQLHSMGGILSHGFWQWLILPLDKFREGVMSVFSHDAAGHMAFLNGQFSTQGWWYYFPLVMWYKMTLVEIFLLVLSIILSIGSVITRTPTVSSEDAAISDRLLLRQPADRNDIKAFDKFLLILPPLLFLAISMIGSIDIGIRHILPILPFIFIFVSQLINLRYFGVKMIVLVLVLAQIVISILAFPNYIAYFNQIAGGAKGGIEHLNDSNLDWDQNMKRFDDYAKKNNIKKIYQSFWDGRSLPYYGIEQDKIPPTPVNGVVAVSAQWLKGERPGFDIGWVTKYKPDDIIGHGIYIWRFDLKPVEMRKTVD